MTPESTLGWNFRKYKETLLIKPSQKNIQTFYGKVRDVIATNLSSPKAVLIRQLNPMLRGWARYHQGVVAKAAFSRMDDLIFWRLWRWGMRRHSRWSRSAVFQHYWTRESGRWQFEAPWTDRWGESQKMWLYTLADTKIVRHKKVKGDYNPYDPNWEAYGERLRIERMSIDMWDMQRGTLWLQQDGCCAHCDLPMEVDDEMLHDHHIQPIRLGGTDSLSNRVLLHAWCHMRIHALGLEVTKPVPARGL